MDTTEQSTIEERSSDEPAREVQLTKTNKNKDLAVVLGQGYLLDRRKDSRFYWRCQEFYKESCRARLITELVSEGNHRYVSESGEHAHKPSPTKKGRLDALDTIKRKARTTRDKPATIITETHQALSREELATVPSTSAQRQRIIRARRSRHGGSRIEPATLDQLVIPDSLKVTPTGENFLIADSHLDNGQRVISFSTPRNIRLLARSDVVIMDGTFYVVPNLFYQLYSLFGMAGVGTCRRAFPLVFALMSSKTTALYKRLLQDIKEYCLSQNLEFSPRFILTDFEKAAIRACKDEFDSAQHHGCFFHFGQIVFRAVEQHGLRTKFGTSAVFASQIRKLIALAFLKPDEIEDAFEELEDSMPDTIKVNDFLTFFKKNYIINQIGRRRKAAVYPPSFWSVTDLVDKELPRTQNSVEAWHRRFKSNIGGAHPGVLTLIESLREESHYQLNLIDRVERGEDDREGKGFALRERKIRAIYASRAEKTTDEFLLAIGQHIKGLISV